ncbi:PH domain-containing protein [Salinarchaeum sp. IM2453]|uniref:PH domain-containing protein n=1 Tax=Salinarchaeum sp. IM2453 TaxID=2862870 RepID=UPI001C835047|nr:PH domain-containing protein [Salinarchaeum sp. IM2453]QZA88578.1 PH domain-containing protein [Salinarchaeum sp. IM2453]
MKLHRLSIPFRIVENLLSLIGILILLGILITTQTEGVLTFVALGIATILLVTGIAIWQVAYYRRFEYHLTDDTLDIESGVISLREREIPYERIQNVAINRNVFQRAAGLAVVSVETAGGGSTEAKLRYVGTETAHWLQDELSDLKRKAEQDRTVDPTTETSDAKPLFEISGKELVILGIISLDSRFLLVVVLAISAFAPEIIGLLGTASSLLVAVPIALLVLYILTAALSAVYSVTNYYDFKLFGNGDELRYERGLLQRFSGTIPLTKIQALTISENVLARLTGYASLLVETAGYSPGESGGSQSAIPVAKRSRVLQLARDIEPFNELSFTRPPKRTRQRYFRRYIWIVLGLAGIGFLVTNYTGFEFDWYWILVGLVLTYPAAHLKWKHRGYLITDRYILTRNGFWNRTIKIVPYHRVQVTFDRQSVFQMRWNLATLTVDTAGSQSLTTDNSKAVDIDEEVARELREHVIDEMFESIRRKKRRRKYGSFAAPIVTADEFDAEDLQSISDNDDSFGQQGEMTQPEEEMDQVQSTTSQPLSDASTDDTPFTYVSEEEIRNNDTQSDQKSK